MGLVILALAIAGALSIVYLGMRNGKQLGAASTAAAVAVFGVGVLVDTTSTIVPGSETGVVTNLGQITNRTMQPGLNFKLPWEAVTIVNTSVRALKVENSDAFTSDRQHALTSYAVNFSIRPESAPLVLRKFQGEIDTRIIEPRVEFWLKDIEPRYSAADLISKRVEVAKSVQEHLENDLRDNGVDIQAVLITNIGFGDQYQKSSEALAAAQQDLAHERIELQIKTVQAQQVVASARGQAEANKLIRDSLPNDPREAEAIVHLRLVNLLETKWNGAMPTSLGGGSLLSIGAVPASAAAKPAAVEAPADATDGK